MKFTEYLEMAGLTVDGFHRMTSLPSLKISRAMLYAYVSGKRTPRPANKRKIERLTKGKVKFEEWDAD